MRSVVLFALLNLSVQAYRKTNENLAIQKNTGAPPPGTHFVADVYQYLPLGTNNYFMATLGPKCGKDYSAAWINLDKGVHYTGKLSNWEYNDDSKGFSADITVGDWTGKYAGGAWKFLAQMNGGQQAFAFDVKPAKEYRLSASGQKTLAFYGKCSGKKDWTVVVSRKRGQTYKFSATAHTCEEGAEAFMGELQNFKFNTDTKDFSADVSVEHGKWSGKLSGANWKGKMVMGDGHEYACEFHPGTN